MNQLEQLERLAQRLIEGPFRRLFRTQVQPADLTYHLSVAVERRCRAGATPNHYQIWLNPTDYAALLAESSYKAEVARLHREVLLLLTEANYQPYGAVRVVLGRSQSVAVGQVTIETDCIAGIARE